MYLSSFWLCLIPPFSVIGFSRNSLLIVEEQKPLDHIYVQFYSGANDLLFKYFDVQFRVQVSGIGSATQGMFISSRKTDSLHECSIKLFAGMDGDFLTNDLIERVLKNSTTSIRIPDVLILDDSVDGEGVETFTLELVEPIFYHETLAAFGLILPIFPKYIGVIDTSIFVHRNFSQLMVSIEDDDGKSIAYVCTPI